MSSKNAGQSPTYQQFRQMRTSPKEQKSVGLHEQESTISFDGILVEDITEAHKVGLGAYWIEGLNGNRILVAILPDINRNLSAQAFNISDSHKSPYWRWNGNIEKPTFQEPIWCTGKWFGELQDGKFKAIIQRSDATLRLKNV